MSYRVARIDELQDIAYRQDTHMRPVRHHLGITAFGTNAWTAANNGDRLMAEHEEDEGTEELDVVLSGRARFEIDSPRRWMHPRGRSSSSGHRQTALPLRRSPERRCLRSAAGSGQPYEAGGWEVWAEFQPAYEAGDYEAVIDRAREHSRRVTTQRPSTTLPVARH